MNTNSEPSWLQKDRSRTVPSACQVGTTAPMRAAVPVVPVDGDGGEIELRLEHAHQEIALGPPGVLGGELLRPELLPVLDRVAGGRSVRSALAFVLSWMSDCLAMSSSAKFAPRAPSRRWSASCSAVVADGVAADAVPLRAVVVDGRRRAVVGGRARRGPRRRSRRGSGVGSLPVGGERIAVDGRAVRLIADRAGRSWAASEWRPVLVFLGGFGMTDQ